MTTDPDRARGGRRRGRSDAGSEVQQLVPRPGRPRGSIPKQVRGRFSTETLDIGVDALTAVDKSYEHKQPRWFTGNLHTVRFDFGEGAQLTPKNPSNTSSNSTRKST